VSVGGNVRVGSAVSLGRRVSVCVGKIIGVTVDGSVGKGDGLNVHSGVTVGGGEIRRLNPPQLMRRQVSADTPTRTLPVIASLQAWTELWGSRSTDSKAIYFYTEPF
jgi:UDP-3-O-[3-hydroxymyristoyl] glucosamine N-acyltransferase